LHVDSVEKVAVRFSHRRQKIRLLRSACKPLEDSYPAAAIPVLIRSVTVHELVDRPQTVVHAGANHVAVEKFARWADPLTSQIPRVLAAGVAQILNSPRVSAYPICGVQGAAYRVQLDVQRFDVTHGEVATVDVLWSVSPPGKGLPLTGRARRAGSGYDALVAANSRSAATVGRDIAAAIHLAQSPLNVAVPTNLQAN
jgi:uncharacterized lipoprotein YmbA